jgi:ubiquinone/menaquinone biosynthesis C-methylase UbiE
MSRLESEEHKALAMDDLMHSLQQHCIEQGYPISFSTFVIVAQKYKMSDLLERTRAVQQRWEELADCYAANVAQLALKLGRAMVQEMKLLDARSILEAGCGPGALTLDMARLLKDRSVRIVATDITEAMIKKTSSIEFPCAVEVAQADAQDLSAFSADSFDRYVACLSLMLVPEADLMIQESFRVLSPGGIAGFTIWGDRKRSPIFTCIEEAYATCGHSVASGKRSNFYLADDEPALRDRFLKHGFRNVVTWHFGTVAEPFDIDSAMEFMRRTPMFLGLELPKDLETRFDEELRKILSKTFGEGIPLQIDAIIILCRK